MSQNITRPALQLNTRAKITRARKLSDRQITIERKIRRQFIIENKGR
jgi:hypothetical protein